MFKWVKGNSETILYCWFFYFTADTAILRKRSWQKILILSRSFWSVWLLLIQTISDYKEKVKWAEGNSESILVLLFYSGYGNLEKMVLAKRLILSRTFQQHTHSFIRTNSLFHIKTIYLKYTHRYYRLLYTKWCNLCTMRNPKQFWIATQTSIIICHTFVLIAGFRVIGQNKNDLHARFPPTPF